MFASRVSGCGRHQQQGRTKTISSAFGQRKVWPRRGKDRGGNSLPLFNASEVSCPCLVTSPTGDCRRQGPGLWRAVRSFWHVLRDHRLKAGT